MPLRVLLLAFGTLAGCQFSVMGDVPVDVDLPNDAAVAFVDGYWQYQAAKLESRCGDPPDAGMTPPPD